MTKTEFDWESTVFSRDHEDEVEGMIFNIHETVCMIRAGVMLAGMSLETVSELADVKLSLVKRVLLGERKMDHVTIDKIVLALQRKGIVFTQGSPETGPSVKLNKRLD